MTHRTRRRPPPAHDGNVATVSGRATPDEPGLDFERLLFFSDAVFAIAITLLIIEIRLPPLPEHPTDEHVLEAIRTVLPSVFAYGLSFATIGLYWLAHWRRYRYVTGADKRLVALNLVLLGLIAFIPFPTAVIGEHGDTAAAVIFYVITLSAAWLVGPLTWLYAWRAGLVRPGVTARYARFAALRGFSGSAGDARLPPAPPDRRSSWGRAVLAPDPAGPDRGEPALPCKGAGPAR